MRSRSLKRILARLRRAVSDPRCPRCLHRHGYGVRSTGFLLCSFREERLERRRRALRMLASYQAVETLNVALKSAAARGTLDYPEWAEVQYRNLCEALDLRIEQADGSRLITPDELRHDGLLLDYFGTKAVA